LDKKLYMISLKVEGDDNEADKVDADGDDGNDPDDEAGEDSDEEYDGFDDYDQMDTEEDKDRSGTTPADTPIKGGDSDKSDKGSKIVPMDNTDKDSDQTLKWVEFLRNTFDNTMDGENLLKAMELIDEGARDETLPLFRPNLVFKEPR
jgi:hypothetical protein